MRVATQPFIDAACNKIEGVRALDLGCGAGRISRLMRARGASVVGVDPSRSMLAKARSNSPKEITFLDGRAETIPCPDGRFDLVVSCLALDHIATLDKPFLEIGRVLAPSGRVVIAGPHASFQFYVTQHPSFEVDGKIFYVFSHIHRLETYFRSAQRAGLYLSNLSEPTIGAATVERFPQLRPLLGAPLAFGMEFRKP
jgi:malonyl-CoA O-methyltransferase